MQKTMNRQQPWQIEINQWEAQNLDRNGVYMGSSLPGFCYKPGEYIPTHSRYSAMASHRWAMEALRRGRKA